MSGGRDMKNRYKTKEQLLNELAVMRQRISDFEKAESGRRQTEEELRQSLQKVRRTLNGTVSALAITVEMRDPYTAGHQERVAQLACAIAVEMNLSDDQIEGLHVAGSLHDLGKILVPAEILNKPGLLNDTEVIHVRTHPQAGHDILMGFIKGHPQAGYDILKEINFPWPVAQIVLQHHERIDGSGYPEGLKGDDILAEARILAVADVVEAMSSHRPYRPAHGLDKALEEIFQKKGALYDPEVVDTCITLFTQKQFQFT
ncbi:MAG: HD-GYP domain-containing protein [Gemmatimonadota bacterium]|nr:MAG: HD-GYP domain-containing protein [Gemmatimonadota bacterium]